MRTRDGLSTTYADFCRSLSKVRSPHQLGRQSGRRRSTARRPPRRPRWEPARSEVAGRQRKESAVASTLRISANRACGVADPVTPPPITIRPGLKNETRQASTCPTRRPRSRISWTATGSPRRRPRDRRPRRWLALLGEHPASGAERPARRRSGRVPGEGRAAGERLEAAGVAARARGAEVVDADVADVAGAAVHAAVELAVDDDPAADAGADLHEEEVAGGRGRRRRAARPGPSR